MLVKMSDLVLPGTGSAHLGDTKVRGSDCFYTVPDKKYAEAVWEALGLDPTKMGKMKDMATPGVKRETSPTRSLNRWTRSGHTDTDRQLAR